MNDDELERAYDAHAAGLFRYLATFTRSDTEARDLLQELFIKLAGSSASAAAHGPAWYYRLAHNLAIDWLRRRQARWDTEERLLQEPGADRQPPANPDAALLEATLAEALRRLPVEQRTVVQLKLWDHLTFQEIAEAQEIPLNTAASRYRYALETLRTHLRPLYEELR